MQDLFSQENQPILIIIMAVIFLLLMGIALLSFFFFSRKKITEKELEKKQLELNHQKEILQATITTQEEERKRIAQDLHDDVSSKLNVITLNANLLADGDLTDEEFTFINQKILKITDETLFTSRKIAHNLLPPILNKFGLEPAINELVGDFNDSKKIVIASSIQYPKEYLSKDNELHFFRILQELINNSIRHGKAKNASLAIENSSEKLTMKYSDNGIGFDTSNTQLKKGIGLQNIESRVAILRGKFTIESQPNKGVNVTIAV